jgi:putative endonuclease
VADSWTVYVLECADGSLYTGVTRDLDRRLRQHNGLLSGGARYTSGRRPVQLRWSAAAPSRSAAQQREAAIKKLSPAAKRRLVE